MNFASRHNRFLIAAAALLVAVILLGFAVVAGRTQAIDLRISTDLVLQVGKSDPLFIAFMQGVSWIGGGIPRWIIVITLSALVWHWCGPRCAVALAGASLLSNLASSLLKLGFGVSRPDIATQVRFRKAEQLRTDEKALRASTPMPAKGTIKILTSCPSCLQGLSRYKGDLESGLLEADYIVVEMANRILGAYWMPDYVAKANAGGIERVLV